MSSTAVTPGGVSTVPAAVPLAIKVTWPNAGTALLPEAGASITVTVDGAAVAPVESSTGVRTFSFPMGAAQVQVHATFSATLGPVAALSAPRMTAVVLDATQTYSVDGTQLKAQSIADYGGPHPLFTIRSATARMVTVEVRTEFVDVGPFWAKFAQYWDYYLAEHNAATTTHVLGFTGGMPLVWLAIVPNAMASFSRPSTSCLVFYRPASYTYDRLDQVHDLKLAIGRYFLSPKPDRDSAAREWERDHVWVLDGAYNNLVRCRFEQAIAESQRALVMLHPWPSRTNFGVAQTASMPSASQLALRFLWSKGAICKGVAGVQLGRLGISGFSRGGDALWASLLANQKVVREVYAFDCTSTDTHVDAICRWFDSGDSNFLRLINGQNNFDVHAHIQRRLDPRHVSRRISVVPPSPTEYDRGHNSVWDHYVSSAPPHLTRTEREDTRHQWAICGGEMMGGKTLPYDPDAVVSYLQEALNASGFHRLSG